MKQQPLMMDDLSPIKKAALAGLVQHPGWAVVEELHMDACKRATEDVLKQDPTQEGHERKVLALQLRARERNEFSLLILSSVQYHISAAQTQELEKNAKPPHNSIFKRNEQ